MGEREAGAALRGHQAPDHDGSGVREEDFSLESLDMLRVIGTGTFARVCLCQVRRWQPSIEHNHIVFQDKGTSNYYALKILTMSQVIKLKQVEHVINERDILRQALEQRTITLSDFIGNLFQRGEPPLHSLPALELQGLSLPLHALSLHLWWRTFQSPQEHTTVILWFAVKCFFVDSITPFVCHGNFPGLQDLT